MVPMRGGWRRARESTVAAIAGITAATPALAAHSGIVASRTGFAWSDVAAFVAFVGMIVLARRAIRKRKRKD